MLVLYFVRINSRGLASRGIWAGDNTNMAEVPGTFEPVVQTVAESKEAWRATTVGLGASIVLAGGKLAAGILGHSTALIADAIESFADAGSSLVVLQGMRVARQPPDEDHPYGHGKAEAVSALIVCVMLLIAAALIIISATQQLLVEHQAPRPWTLIVLLSVIVVKELLFRFVLAAAHRDKSGAAEADAWHHRADAITSLAAFIGVTVAIWGPGWFNMPRLVIADEVAALLASGVIIYTAMRLLHGPLHELLDAAPPELLEQVRNAAAGVESVRDVEKVLARKSGKQYLVDMHLHVDPAMNVRDAHALSGKVKATIRREVPIVRDVLIHIEPAVEVKA